MEQNTQAFTSGQGRGAATILQPYDPTQDVAQTMNIIRNVRQKQDEQKKEQQKQISSIVDADFAKGVWTPDVIQFTKEQQEVKDKWLKVLATKDKNNFFLTPEEQLQKQADFSTLQQKSDTLKTQSDAVKTLWGKAWSNPEKYDLDATKKLFDAELVKPWNERNFELIEPVIKVKVEPITTTDFGTTSTSTLGTQKVGDIEVLTTTKTTKERYTPYDVQVDFVSKKTSGVESDMKGTEIQDNLAIGMGFQGGMMDVFEAINDPKNPRYKEAKLVYDVWVNKAVKKNDVGVTKTAAQLRADENKNSASQNMLLAGVTASKAPVSVPVSNAQGEITDGKYETPSLSLGVNGQSYTTASAEYYDPVKRQFVTTTGTSSTPPMFNANLVYLPFPKSPEKAGWYMYGNVQLGKGWQDAAYKINDKGLQQAMTHKKILTVNDENGSTVDGVEMLEELLLSTGVTKDSKEYKSFEEMSKPIRTANYGKAKKSTMTQNTTTKNNGFAGQAKRAM